ncbi:MAG: efflux RND transporter periplasmic adaptor subunit [Sandaracinaceae bacterium]
MSTEQVQPTVEDGEGVAGALAPEPVDKPSFAIRLFSVVFPGVVCLVGIAFAGLMVSTRPDAERTDTEATGVPVRLLEVAASSEDVVVRGQGQVIAAQQVRVQPEVSGRITWVNENLVPGGLVSQRDRLFRVDTRDYRAALAQQQAQLASAQLALSQEGSRRTIAEREWALLNGQGGGSESGRQLALRGPQQESAQAQLRAAQSGVAQARTNLGRATVTAPFDAVVQIETAELGQLVTPAAQIATLIGTEHFWVQVSIPVEQLAWVQVPRGETPGSEAVVTQLVGESGEIQRTGRVVRLMSDLDPVGRMARLLIEIDDPLGLASNGIVRGDASSLPMLIGGFVRVSIGAGTVEGVVEVPRGAVHDGGIVYLMNEASELVLQPVETVWGRDETLLVRGIPDGAQVVTSTVSPPVPGTQLRRIEEEVGAAEPAASEGETAP